MDRAAENIKMMELSKGEIYLEIKIDMDDFFRLDDQSPNLLLATETKEIFEGQNITTIFALLKPLVPPTYSNFGRLLKSCDIIMSIEALTRFPILSKQV